MTSLAVCSGRLAEQAGLGMGRRREQGLPGWITVARIATPQFGGRVSTAQDVASRLGCSADVGDLTPAPAGGIRPAPDTGGSQAGVCSRADSGHSPGPWVTCTVPGPLI